MLQLEVRPGTSFCRYPLREHVNLKHDAPQCRAQLRSRQNDNFHKVTNIGLVQMFRHSNHHPQSYEFHWKWSNASHGHQIAQSTAEHICQTRLWYIVTIYHSLMSIFGMQWLQKLFNVFQASAMLYMCTILRQKKTFKYNLQAWILWCWLRGINYLGDMIIFFHITFHLGSK